VRRAARRGTARQWCFDDIWNSIGRTSGAYFT
jgi:hypothetical protein